MTTQNPPRNQQPSTRKQTQGALYPIFPSFVSPSTKSTPPPQFWPSPKYPEILPPMVVADNGGLGGSGARKSLCA